MTTQSISLASIPVRAALVAIAALSVAVGPAPGQTRGSTSPEPVPTPRRVTAKMVRDRGGQPTYQLPNGSRVSCQAGKARVFDCFATDGKGRALDHGSEIWLARIEQGSLTVTAVGRRAVPGACLPGSQLKDLSRVAALIAEGRARAEQQEERRRALLEEAQHQDAVCEMCDWYGSCWGVPCILPPDKD